jgi:hypothetical protein
MKPLTAAVEVPRAPPPLGSRRTQSPRLNTGKTWEVPSEPWGMTRAIPTHPKSHDFFVSEFVGYCRKILSNPRRANKEKMHEKLDFGGLSCQKWLISPSARNG